MGTSFVAMLCFQYKEIHVPNFTATYLHDRLVDKLSEAQEATLVFKSTTATISPDLLSHWKKMDTKLYFKNGEWHSIYYYKTGPGLSSLWFFYMIV